MANRSVFLIAALLSAPALGAISEPSGLTPRLRAPATEAPAFVLAGSGVYVYECKATVEDPNVFAWYFVAPDATLYDGSRNAGRHATVGLYEAASDRTSVSGVVRATQGAGAGNLPWALLRARPVGEVDGLFQGVTSIQRVNTSGGAPPATGCDSSTAGNEFRSAYNADYYFYKPRGAS
jgi:uncharacterized protein DUF3455